MNKRAFESSKKYGYLFYIKYNGKDFQSFDENSGKVSVKSEFIRVMNEIGITWAKGVQQASRTDAGVSADENILYISTLFNGDKDKKAEEFNKKSKFLKIVKVEKTFPDLVIPDLVEKRVYHYEYPLNKLKKSVEEIEKKACELSGTYDVSEFTDAKGALLKEKVRSVNITFERKKLIFEGSSFMPKQVRIMSGVILEGEKKIMASKYLTLHKNIMKSEFDSIIFQKSELKVEGVEYIEKAGEILLFYVKSENRGEIIGTNGKNIKKLRKEYGELIIRDV
jgi:tRNA pseudouridine38-40 synthase